MCLAYCPCARVHHPAFSPASYGALTGSGWGDYVICRPVPHTFIVTIVERKAMTEIEVPKLEIACEYLDAAIEFFLERTNFFCAINLAAAAGELFDAHLPESEQMFTLAWKRRRRTSRSPSRCSR